MVNAVIFDMDGLLIDSEPLWQEAEMAVFGRLGVPITPTAQAQTMGLRTDQTVEYWYRRHPWHSPSRPKVCQQIDEAVIALIKQKGAPMPGALEVVATCEALGLRLALASSSSVAIITATLDKLGLADKFAAIHSADAEPFGKPHPAVYLSTADTLGVHPDECLVLEDSLNGVISAKAASMRCIAVPNPEQRDDTRFGVADLVVSSLTQVTAPVIQRFND
jgi:HAD superfamily hydrolase (TIGR01509 family)